jgi:hypothetical protein
MQKTNWIVSGTSTVDDTKYGPLVLHDYPTNDMIRDIIKDWGGTFDPNGTGNYGSNITVKIDVVNVEIK